MPINNLYFERCMTKYVIIWIVYMSSKAYIVLYLFIGDWFIEKKDFLNTKIDKIIQTLIADFLHPPQS